ncbi:MAG: hypothetical protein J0H43_08795 [Actinobacteria bacterium]|nr:hypothetical protein [Actinomycetota bacterium]
MGALLTVTATITTQLEGLGDRIGIVHLHLEINDQRLTSTEQPATERWRGLAASVNRALTQAEDWPRYAEVLDAAARDGIDVATNCPSSWTLPASHPRTPAAAPAPPALVASRPGPAETARPSDANPCADLAAAG